jgi:hypothetical protein
MGSLLAFDYNNDHMADMLIGHRLETNLGNYQFSESLLSFPGLYAFDKTFADVDGNGYNDIIFIGNNDTGLVTIYFGDGAGDFTADPPNTVDQDNTSVLSIPISLSVYPNPFRESATISFKTSKPQPNTLIEIYNIKGQKIKSITLPYNKTEDVTITWDGRDYNNKIVANGIYLGRIISNEQNIASTKIVKTAQKR